MLNLSHVNIRINKDSIKWLKRKGVSIPEQADTVEHIFIPKNNEYTEMFTFKDRKNLRLTQQKNNVNKKTKEKNIQIREYEYIKRESEESKISEIKQKTISPNGEEKGETWRFYHAKDGYPVRFSYYGKDVKKNNFLQSDGVYIDKLGLKIKPISTAEYIDKRKNLDEKHYVGAPWTLKESITTNERCGTDSVQECTVVGIYGDKGLSLNHLNPNNRANADFRYIEWELLDQLEQQGKNAKAFVIGSCEDDYFSNKQYNNIIDLLATENVPFSSYKTGDNVLYGQFKRATSFNVENAKKYKNGTASLFEWRSGQHIIYNNGEIQLANPVIDYELKRGETNPKKLVQHSFTKINKNN